MGRVKIICATIVLVIALVIDVVIDLSSVSEQDKHNWGVFGSVVFVIWCAVMVSTRKDD